MIGNKVCFFQTIDSTNDYVKNHMRLYKHGDMICAKVQTAGRGRRDRNWVSEDGNLHTTLVLEQDVCNYDAFEVVMRTSLAIVKLLEEYGIKATIKYPNDILVERHKIAGILIEKLRSTYVVGIGINVTFNDKDVYDFNPSSILLETGRFVDYRDVLSGFINAYNNQLGLTTEEIYQLYKEYSLVLNQTIVVDKKEVIVLDITIDGHLKITQEGKETLVSPNEISLKDIYREK